MPTAPRFSEPGIENSTLYGVGVGSVVILFFETLFGAAILAGNDEFAKSIYLIIFGCTLLVAGISLYKLEVGRKYYGLLTIPREISVIMAMSAIGLIVVGLARWLG